MNFFENSHHKSSIIPEFYNQDPNKIPKLLVERFRDGGTTSIKTQEGVLLFPVEGANKEQFHKFQKEEYVLRSPFLYLIRTVISS